MDYIVFDLEWNQCPYGKERENEKLPFEIIEIGAVRLNDSFEEVDRYQRLIQPVVYKKLHYRTQEIIGLSMKELEKGMPFYKMIRDFLKWCGKDYIFCTWGNTDLIELQRNMKYYGLLHLLKGPVKYLNVQKLFSIDYEDGKSRKALEYGVDFFQMEKQEDFHRALADAWYTAMVLKKIDIVTMEKNFSFDTYQAPKTRADEIYVYNTEKAKYISAQFDTKEEIMEDREVLSCRCLFCNRNARKKIRWFSINARNYYCLAVCPDHGLFRGQIHMKHTDEGKFYIVKTLEPITEDSAAEIREKQVTMRIRRRQKRKAGKA